MSQPRDGEVRIGISGWRYVPWRGVFYPPGLAQHRELSFAASRFRTVEISVPLANFFASGVLALEEKVSGYSPASLDAWAARREGQRSVRCDEPGGAARAQRASAVSTARASRGRGGARRRGAAGDLGQVGTSRGAARGAALRNEGRGGGLSMRRVASHEPARPHVARHHRGRRSAQAQFV